MAALAVSGCTAENRDDAESGGLTAFTTADSSAETSGDGPTSDDSSGSDSANSSGTPKLDVGDGGMNTAGDPNDGPGCEKVDFLFVVDNSGSMEDEQLNLKTSFPGFIDTIGDTLQAQDYHIMAVSTDNGQGGGSSTICINGECSCTPAPACCDQVCMTNATCNGFDCNNLPGGACETEYGSGKTFDENGNDCMIEAGRRYMTDSQPDVKTTFECVATVGTYGSGDEKPMLAMTRAIADEMNGPMDCNEGFLRDDAILVVTFMTDEEDDNAAGDGSPGSPAEWVDAVIAAKGGNPDAVVVLGLIGDGDQPNGQCAAGDPNNGGNGAEASPRLRAFVEGFPNGRVGSVCAADYTPFFVEAVSVIDTACDEFVPEG